jgi:hypothetical protein
MPEQAKTPEGNRGRRDGIGESAAPSIANDPTFSIAYEMANDLHLDDLAAEALRKAASAEWMACNVTVSDTQRAIAGMLAEAYRLRLIERARVAEAVMQEHDLFCQAGANRPRKDGTPVTRKVWVA